MYTINIYEAIKFFSYYFCFQIILSEEKVGYLSIFFRSDVLIDRFLLAYWLFYSLHIYIYIINVYII